MIDLGAPLPLGERVHVYQLPLLSKSLNKGYCFHGGNVVEFLNVDFFDLPDGAIAKAVTLGDLIDALYNKSYALRGYPYLILGETFAHRVRL